MKTVPESEAIALFAELMTPFIHSPPATGMIAVERFIQFYRDVRVEAANDSMMLQWGCGRPLIQVEFTNLCDSSADGTTEPCKYQWIGMTRQIDSGNGDDDKGLSLDLFFEEEWSVKSSNIEFWGLNELDENIGQFITTPFVATLLSKQPFRVTAYACCIG